MPGFIDPDAVRELAKRLRGHAEALFDEADDLDDLAELLENDDGGEEDEDAEERDDATADTEAE